MTKPGWYPSFSAFGVLARFQTNGIITHIQHRIYNDDIFTRFKINAITVLSIGRISDKNTIDDNILAHQRMYIPAWRIFEQYSLQIHILTTVATKIVAFCLDRFANDRIPAVVTS
jgi:hypothetical protein